MRKKISFVDYEEDEYVDVNYNTHQQHIVEEQEEEKQPTLLGYFEFQLWKFSIRLAINWLN